MAETTVRRIGAGRGGWNLVRRLRAEYFATRVGGHRNYGDRRTRLAESDCNLRVCRGELFLFA